MQAIIWVLVSGSLYSQSTIKGIITDATLNESLIGANVIVKGSANGTTTDWDGSFSLNVDGFPVTLEISYLGYETKDIEVLSENQEINVLLGENAIVTDVVTVRGQKVSDKQKAAPLTIESLGLLAIKETPSENFYDGLGALKGVDMTAASLGFKVINTRGFNSTSPVRTLQIIDGVDNQSPGLNFSLGNFLGSSELDVLKVDIIQGATTAFYGPNAFNGVISLHTKDPFFHKGLAFSGKLGEQNLYSGAIRFADALSNKEGFDVLAFKFNAFYLTANDWLSDNKDAVDGSVSRSTNLGGYNAVNTYGDEFLRGSDERRNFRRLPGLGVFHRTGYTELDLIDEDRDGNIETKNLKLSGNVHFRLKPELEYNSPEIVLGSAFGGGTTVYQGENRFSLKNIKFFQHKIELKKKDKYFWRTYMTHEDAGDSYDPFFTALKLQESARSNGDWNLAYKSFYQAQIVPRIKAIEGFPQFQGGSAGNADSIALDAFFATIPDSLEYFHELARNNADLANPFDPRTSNRFIPGTEEYANAFDSIVTANAYSEGGTRFFDKSALIHSQAEYKFNNVLSNNKAFGLDFITGVSGRIFMPNSQGSILLDTGGVNIDTWEYGIYGGATVSLVDNKVKLNFSARYDDHKNFSPNFSPAGSLVYTPAKNNFLRISFSSAVRNPTLADQYLNYNVGPAILRGNINGINNLVPIDAFINFLNTNNQTALEETRFDIAPIKTEKVKTLELGYRTTIFNSLYIDAGYYYSRYRDFIGYQFGIDPTIAAGLIIDAQAFRVASNASQGVTTQGFSIGYNYYFANNYSLNGNYSWNKLTSKVDDPIIPAFNTPEHKYNIGISGRDLSISKIRNIGFNINYKWIEGFLFEGSPQFTGLIPSYALLDAQINWKWSKYHTTIKIGASNLLDQRNFQTYGGPRIGRLGYLTLVYDWKK